MRHNSENVKKCAQLRKENLIKVFGSKCCLCGFNKFNSALEFHHVNPEEKEFGLTGSGLMRKMEIQLQEARKCILVCSNCHRGIHHENIAIPDDWQQLFNDEIADELLREHKEKLMAHENYCIDCGVKISKNAKRCEECSSKIQRWSVRPSRQELKDMIRTMPFTKIGEIFYVSDNAIRKWCKAENLPSKKTEINKFSDEEWSKI